MNGSRALFKLYMLPYTKVVKREIGLGDVGRDDVVLNVGCGSMPFTAVLIANLTGAKVVAVDIDEEAVETARRTVSMLGLEDRVEVLHADGGGPIGRRFNKAVLALHVEPKDVVVSKVLENPDVEAVVLRMPRGALMASYGGDRVQRPFCKQVTHLMPTFDRSLLFTV